MMMRYIGGTFVAFITCSLFPPTSGVFISSVTPGPLTGGWKETTAVFLVPSSLEYSWFLGISQFKKDSIMLTCAGDKETLEPIIEDVIRLVPDNPLT